MGIQQIGRRISRWQLFTASNASWTVPVNIVRGTDGAAIIFVDGCSAGGGGGGGDPTPGGGGGGGGGGTAVSRVPLPVIAGELLNIQVGAGGLGGLAGVSAVDQSLSNSSISSSTQTLYLPAGRAGVKGTSPNGGTGGGVASPGNPGGTGGAAAGGNGLPYGGLIAILYGHTLIQACKSTSGSAGGALNFGGGTVQSVWMGDANLKPASTGNASGGGGGRGGGCLYGDGGAGGNNGAAGSTPALYGGGGGGGSGNSAGAAGAPGFFRLHWEEWAV